MNLGKRWLAIASLGLISSSAFALSPKHEISELPQLVQESQHVLASKRVYNNFMHSHYKRVGMDDAFSQKIFDRFIKQLDYNKQFFLQKDIDELSMFSKEFDDAFYRGNLAFAYEIYSTSQKRRYQRFEYALSLLDKEMEFTKPDTFHYDREDLPWATTKAELDEYWRQKVKYDALNLKLAGKDWAKIKELLGKRYNSAIRRLTQTQSEDVFQLVMNAFARSVEAHTSYLSPRSADRFQMEMNLSLEGIGAVLFIEDDYTVIRSLVAGGPADKSKQLKPEDRIVGVAQKNEEFVDVIGWRLDDVVELIKGPKGTEVRLQIIKGDGAGNQAQNVTLIRDKIKLEDRAATSEIYVPDEGAYKGRRLGVIDIPSFYNNLTRDVDKELTKLKVQNVEGIVIDLRGNGGGSLPESIMLTGLFIEQGPVVQVRKAVDRIEVSRDRDRRISYSGPLVVLVDRYSASASEIFSAALQDYGRAVIVGENTFGKGTVQQHKALSKLYDKLDKPLGHIQFTFAKFYRINGGSTQHKGVTPDILFPSPIAPAEWGESKEENALPWDKIASAKYQAIDSLVAEIKALTKNHQKRIKQDPEFAYIFEDISEYQKTKDQKSETLVEAERIKRKEENQAKRLARANDRLKRLKEEPIKDLETLPEVLEDLDPILDETANIAFELVDFGKLARQ